MPWKFNPFTGKLDYYEAGGGGTPSNTVTPETSFGQSPNAGLATTYSRGDHTHGTPEHTKAIHDALNINADTVDGHHASDFAPASQGVTNGNSHDHSGGDGAQINHTTLSNIGVNTHAQIDSHIADVNKHIDWTNATQNLYTSGQINVGANQYYGFGTTTGSSGYGIRDNSGTVEVKSSGKDWLAILSSQTTKNIYVDGVNGDDSTGNGTTSAPYKTFAKAKSMLGKHISATVNIYFAPATYAENFDLTGFLYSAPIYLFPWDGTTSPKTMFVYNQVADIYSSTTIGHSSLNLAENKIKKVWIIHGTGKGQYRDVSSNTATTITVSSPWTTTPDSTSQFCCCGDVIIATSSNEGIYANLLGQVYVYGLQIINTAGNYALTLRNSSFMAIRSCYIKPYSYGINAQYFSNLNITGNLFVVTAASIYGINATYGVTVYSNGNIFIGPGTTGRAISMQYGCSGAGGANTSAYPTSYFANWNYGIYCSTYSFLGSASLQTYSSCTNNYLITTTVDSSVISALFECTNNCIQIDNSKTPASSSATGTKGQICWDSNYIYVCVATNTWKRAALSSW